MKTRKRKSLFWLLAFLMVGVPGAAVAADVDVFAEGAYTTTNLVVYIYANINADNLCSYGVKLSYDAGKLNVPTAEKNDAIWYFGTSSSKQPYMNPDTSTAGQVIFIGGKLDTGSPTAGVTTGSRILLGKATFTRNNDSTMGLGTTAQDYFGINLALGKASPYDNFVTTTGVVKDGAGVGFNTANNKVRERGDANGDGSINSSDYVAIRNLLPNPIPPVFADCNADGAVNSSDYVCVRNKIN
jgi:hypothetical protein